MRGGFPLAFATVSATAVTALWTLAAADLAVTDLAAAQPGAARTHFAQAAQVAQTSDSTTSKPDLPTGGLATGTPAAVVDNRELDSILGKTVQSSKGENMGRIVDVLVSRAGQVRGVVIDFGGFLGVGSRKIAVAWNSLRFNPPGKSGQIAVDLTKDQLRVAPEYKPGEPVVILGAASPAAGPTSSPPATQLENPPPARQPGGSASAQQPPGRSSQAPHK